MAVQHSSSLFSPSRKLIKIGMAHRGLHGYRHINPGARRSSNTCARSGSLIFAYRIGRNRLCPSGIALRKSTGLHPLNEAGARRCRWFCAERFRPSSTLRRARKPDAAAWWERWRKRLIPSLRYGCRHQRRKGTYGGNGAGGSAAWREAGFTEL